MASGWIPASSSLMLAFLMGIVNYNNNNNNNKATRDSYCLYHTLMSKISTWFQELTTNDGKLPSSFIVIISCNSSNNKLQTLYISQNNCSLYNPYVKKKKTPPNGLHNFECGKGKCSRWIDPHRVGMVWSNHAPPKVPDRTIDCYPGAWTY